MSSYFDLVINCDLRPDLPQEYIDALRYLTSPEGITPILARPQAVIQSEVGSDLWDFVTEDGPLLSSDPNIGFIVNFYSVSTYGDKTVHQYHLQLAARHVHTDLWADGLAEFFYWLPTIAADGFIGYHKGTDSNELHLLYAKEGHRVDQNGNPLFTKPGPLPPDM